MAKGIPILLRNHQSPGDVVAMTYALKALHEQYPEMYSTGVECSAPAIFEGNPYVDWEVTAKTEGVKVINTSYPTIHRSNQRPYRFATGFVYDLADQLGVKLELPEWHGSVYIRDQEKSWFSVVREKVGKDVPYWVLDAGFKTDYTAKAWSFEKYQQVVDRCPDIHFVQIGLVHPDHIHPPLKGDNLLNLLGKTDMRQLIRLVWNAWGVLTPVSLPMMLSYAVPAHPRFKRKSRACVVLSGGREPDHWQAPPNTQFLHTCGQLDCCDMGGCWKSRLVPLNDGSEKDSSLCIYPKQTASGQWVARCMDMISVDEVVAALRRYQDNLNYTPAC